MEAQTPNALLSPPELSPLEQELLDEYERLAENMKKASYPITITITCDSSYLLHDIPILDGLRELERKTSLVFTLLKASVYSIVLQQEIDWGDQPRA
ncbi:DASH complex, subunit Dad3 [Hypoxylon sp. NC1633]|nr:DASH complex, subunit Dad3 [Hypoxylon sp. NC1633]